MLKKIAMMLSILILFTCIFCPDKTSALNINIPSNEEVSKLPEDSKEAIVQDVAISLLIPSIQKEINNYYKDYLTQLPVVFAYSVDIISVKRVVGYRIQLVLLAHPFVGPIDTVGDDRIIIETGAFGSVKIIKFEHIKSYKLPWN